MKILSLTKSNDFLGESINFSINRKPIFQTVAGGSLSILIYLLYFQLFYVLGLDFFFKRNPIVYSQIKTNNEPAIPKINLTSDDFIFGIRFEDDNGQVLDIEDYAYANMTFNSYLFNITQQKFIGGENEMEMTSCDKFPKIKEKIPNSIFNLSTFKCPNISKYKNRLEIGGQWEDNHISFLLLDLYYCKDKEKKICKNPQKLANKSIETTGFYIVLLYPEIIFNANNYTNPFKFNFNYHFNVFNPKTLYRDQLYLGYNHLNDDAGIIFEESKDTKEIGGLKLRTTSRIIDKFGDQISSQDGNINMNDSLFYTTQVYFGREYIYHTRKYMKFQDLLANVSGCMELVIFIIGFLYKIYNKFRLDTYLFNRLVYIKREFKDENVKIPSSNSNCNVDKGSKKIQIQDLNKKAALKEKISENFISKNIIKESSDLRCHYVNTSGVVKTPQNLQITKIKDISNSLKANELNQFYNKSESFIEADNASSLRISQHFDEKAKIKQEPAVNCSQIKPNISNLNDDLSINKSSKKEIDKLNLIRIIENLNKQKNGVKFSMLDYFAYALGIINKKKKEKFCLMKNLEEYSEKIYEQFDIFNYLKNLKSLKLLKKLFLEKEELLILNKISEKSYAVEMDFNKLIKHNKSDKRYKKDVEFLIENFLNSGLLLNEKMLNLISSLD